MMLIAALLAAGLFLFAVVLLVRAWEADTWARTLIRYRLSLPRDLAASDVAGWLAQVGSQTIPPRFSLLQAWPVALEIEATSKGITHTVLVPKGREVALLASLRAALPQVRVEALDKAEEPTPRFRAGIELRLTSHTTPLGDDRAAVAANGVLGALQPLADGAAVRIQYLFAGVRARKETGSETDALRWLVGAEPRERSVIRDQRQKQRAPLLVASARLAASGPTKGHAFAILHRIVGALRVLEAPGAHFLWRIIPSWLAVRRIVRRQVPLLSFPLTVNTLEAVGLVAFPLNGAYLPGLRLGSSRQVPPSPDTPRRGVVIGESSYPGSTQTLAVKPRDLLMHTYALGPSGTGKSTLLGRMALDLIEAGYSVIVIDPKADLVSSLLDRYPETRREDLILLDPSNLARPTGFNPLATHGGEHGRELAAETIAHILRDIYREFWGPRTDDLLRASLLSLVQVPALNGERFAMTEIPELLTNAALRRYVATHPRQHERWKKYWHDYDQRSQADQLSMIGPVLNKLRAFTHRTSLRLVLGQADGIDLSEVFTKRKVFLAPLSAGQIGPESSALIGSLLVGSLFQAAMQRTNIAPEKRRPAFAFLDEFQNIVRISNDVTDSLATARGLGLGMILAHQYAKQVPEPVRAAVLGTVRTQIFFQTEYDDAQLLAKRLAPVLTANDLMGQGRYEITARLCIDGQTRSPVTGRTLPLAPATRDGEALRHELATQHGTARAEVEAGLLARTHVKHSTRPTRLGEVPSEEAG
jgi:TraM recognition site of TraD and TraG